MAQSWRSRIARSALVVLMVAVVSWATIATGRGRARGEGVPSRFEVPPPGMLTWGVSGTDSLEALVATQGFDVAGAFVLDEASGQWLRFIPGAPAAVNTLGPGRLRADTIVLLRRRGDRPTSVFDFAQVVSFYGHPDVARMGALGTFASPADAADAIERMAAAYEATGDGRQVIGAFHIVAAVAQRSAGADGTYLSRLSIDRLRPYVEVARERGMLVILDIQVGWAEPLDEVKRLEPLLREPFVHVALDPEFATKPDGVAPGSAVGTLDADQINAVQDWLGALVRAHDLPSKVLVVHQFREDMLAETERLRDVAEVDLVIDMDGFGPSSLKLSKYVRFGLSDYAERSGIKLFFDWDTPLLAPAEIQALTPPPNLVVYQ